MALLLLSFASIGVYILSKSSTSTTPFPKSSLSVMSWNLAHGGRYLADAKFKVGDYSDGVRFSSTFGRPQQFPGVANKQTTTIADAIRFFAPDIALIQKTYDVHASEMRRLISNAGLNY